MQNSKGFTLIELMICLAIVGIILSVILPAIRKVDVTGPTPTIYDSTTTTYPDVTLGGQAHSGGTNAEFTIICLEGVKYWTNADRTVLTPKYNGNGSSIPMQCQR